MSDKQRLLELLGQEKRSSNVQSGWWHHSGVMVAVQPGGAASIHGTYAQITALLSSSGGGISPEEAKALEDAIAQYTLFARESRLFPEEHTKTLSGLQSLRNRLQQKGANHAG